MGRVRCSCLSFSKWRSNVARSHTKTNRRFPLIRNSTTCSPPSRFEAENQVASSSVSRLASTKSGCVPWTKVWRDQPPLARARPIELSPRTLQLPPEAIQRHNIRPDRGTRPSLHGSLSHGRAKRGANPASSAPLNFLSRSTSESATLNRKTRTPRPQRP